MDTTKKLQAVYTVVDKGGDGKDIWLRVGSAFWNRDGSLTVKLDAMPTNGKLNIRDYSPRDAEGPRTRARAGSEQAQEAEAV